MRIFFQDSSAFMYAEKVELRSRKVWYKNFLKINYIKVYEKKIKRQFKYTYYIFVEKID